MRNALVLGSLLTLVPILSATASFVMVEEQAAPPADDQRTKVSLKAFETVARVLRHPRCLNCHPSGDRPRVGDDRHLHLMNVQRGPDDHGMPGLNCSACHQTQNQDLIKVPGAPHWGLAPRSMGWEGLDDHALAEQLKDKSRNGNRSLDDLIEHMSHDPLVGWGWAPDAGRTPIPIPREAFIAALKTWIENGAVSPQPGTTTH